MMKHSGKKITTEQIWRELSDRLRQFIRSRVSSEPDLEDILQTVFIRVHQKIDQLDQIKRLESWVFQITRNAIVDYFRVSNASKKRTAEVDIALLPISGYEEVDNFNTEVGACLGTLIEHLPEDQRRAVTMYELEGLSQREIAIRESISLSGAKSRVQRGRKKLEQMLQDCCQLQIDTWGNVIGCGEENCRCE